MAESAHPSMVPGTYGRDPARVTLTPVTIGHAWNVMGAHAPDVAPAAIGVTMPRVPNTTWGSDPMALWIGPASWLVVSSAVPPRAVDEARRMMFEAQAAVFDVSASRVAFALGGAQARDVLAAGCPLDFHPRVFAVGTCAQSVYDRVNALVVRVGHDDVEFVVLVARSFGRDVWHGLCSAVPGYTVLPARRWPALTASVVAPAG